MRLIRRPQAQTPPRQSAQERVRAATAIAACALLVQCIAAAPARAAWSPNGTPVCLASNDQKGVLAASDGAGGMFVAWTDLRAGGDAASDVYVQHLDADGGVVTGWPADGLAACAAGGSQRLGALVADGSGGVFLAWDDARADLDRDVYALHLLANGSLANGWPADGLAVAATTWEQESPLLAADGSGGVFLCWLDGRECSSCHLEVYAQHLDAGGAAVAGWTPGGTRVSTGTGFVHPVAPVPDGSGGVYVAWHALIPRFVVRAQHLDAGGAPSPTWPAGGATLVQSASAGSDEGIVGLVPGPAGTAIVVWTHFDQDNWGCECTDWQEYRAKAVGPDTATVAGWPMPGTPLGTSSSQLDPSSVGDGSGGLLFTYMDYYGTQSARIAVVHVDATGIMVASAAHPDGRVVVRDGPAPMGLSVLASDGAGGAFVGWLELAASSPGAPAYYDYDPFVQHVRADATVDPAWPAGGTLLSISSATEGPTAMAAANDGGVLAGWSRNVGAGTADVYAARIAANGVVLGQPWATVPPANPAFALRGVWPNPASGEARVRFALPGPGEALLSLLDPQGRRLREWGVGGSAGEKELALNGLGRLPPGLYWLRLRHGASEARVRIALVR